MPLGVPLVTLRRLLRAEVGASLNPLQGIAAQQSLDLILDRQQTELWDAYTWKHLRIFRDVPLAAGQFTYNYPQDIPFDQVLTVWFADSSSARWRPLLYGITMGMIPASGPMRGTPCRWDNFEPAGGTIPPPPDNTPPTITSNGGGPTASINVVVGGTFVTTVTAADPDVGQAMTYSIIGGANAGLFNIIPSTGVLSFLAAPGPGTYRVIVQVSDGFGGTDSQDITVTVTSVGANTSPTITSNGGGPTAFVTVVTGAIYVATVAAIDPDVGQTLTYSIVGGSNAGLFTINATTGQLSFLAGAVDGTYDVIVQVSDGHGGTDSQSITVTVSPAPPVNQDPIIISNGGGPTANVTINQGNNFVTRVMATDPDLGTVFTFAIVGGANASQFTIDSSSGLLLFVGLADPAATYHVIVGVSDGHGGSDTQALTATVVVPEPHRRTTVAPFVSITNPVGQFALLPMPASSSMLLRLEGQAPINPLVNDDDRCVLDSRLITLFAAAEVLANQKSEGAPVKLAKAQNYLRQLLKNQAADKRVNPNMGGSGRFGNDPNKFPYLRSVPYLDYIPS